MTIITKTIEKICNILNIHADKNQKLLLISMCVSSLLITYTLPTLTKEIYSSLPAQWIAFQALFSSIVALLIGIIWKGYFRKAAMKYFMWFCIIESICGCLLAWYLCFINWNVWVYAIVSLIYGNFICTLVGKCVMAFKPKLWNDEAREVYDNNISIVGGICDIVGFAIALIFLPSLELSLFSWGLCCVIDDLGWIIVYNRNKEILRESL